DRPAGAGAGGGGTPRAGERRRLRNAAAVRARGDPARPHGGGVEGLGRGPGRDPAHRRERGAAGARGVRSRALRARSGRGLPPRTDVGAGPGAAGDLRERSLDTILDLTRAHPCGAPMATAAREGICIVKHGLDWSWWNDPPGFWEMAEGSPVTFASLWIVREDG